MSLLLSLAVVAAVAVWWVLVTESGARWLFEQVADRLPAELEVRDLSGTLWRGIRLEYISYTVTDRQVELLGLELQANWSEASIAHAAIGRLDIDQLTMTTLAEPSPVSEPMNIDIPPLPVQVTVQSISVDTAEVDGTIVSDIAVRDLDVDALDVQLGSASASVDAFGLSLDMLELELRDDVPLRTGFSWAVTGDQWAGEGRLKGSLRKLELEHELYGDYPLSTAGSIDLSVPGKPTVDVTSSFEGWRYAEWSAGNGNFRFIAAMEDSGQANVDLTAEIFTGGVRVTGNVQWSPELSAELMIVGSDLDISSLTDGVASELGLELILVVANPEEFSAEIRKLTGTYIDRAVIANGTVLRNGDRWRCRQCDAAIGDNRLQADLSLRNRRIDGTIDIRAPSLDQLYPESAGALQATGSLGGSINRPVLTGNLAMRDAVFRDWSVASLTIETKSATIDNVDVLIEANGIAHGDRDIGGGYVRATGVPGELGLESEWSIEGIDVRYAAQVTRNNDVIKGRVLSATITESNTGEWGLAQPVDIVAGPNGLDVDEALWTNADTRLRIGRIASGPESLSAEVDLSGAPLSWLDGHTPSEVAFGGYVDALVDVQRTGPDWTGEFRWRQRDTVLHISTVEGDRFAVAVPVAEARANVGSTGVSLRAQVQADSGIEVDLDATASGLAADADINANLTASGAEWDWLSAFIPEIDEIAGQLNADIYARGRLDAPEYSGELRLANGNIALPTLNVPITDIDARVHGGSSGTLFISGEARSGGGNLSVTGEITDLTRGSPQVALKLRGEGATMLDWPEYRLIASPDLSLSGAGDEYSIDGRIQLEKAEIYVKELPEGVVKRSADVVVTGREESQRQTLRVAGAFDIALGDSVHVRAFGLDTKLAGDLRITLPPERDAQANGELNLVGGYFEMYGQRLEIERGTLLFNGPLDRPYVDARVVRTIMSANGTVVVGADLLGHADEVSSTLFSEPAMSEADALSYLVTGRPLTGLKPGEGQMLSDAAFSLGLRQAGMITNQIGQSVGLDELGVDGSDKDAAALIAGKQITSDLYARYRYGVFSRLGELLLRYSLTESISVELGAGEFQSIDVQYTIERD